MMRSIYYWRSGLTLHLFGVALMEWGSCSCERLAMHPSAFPFYILLYFTLVRRVSDLASAIQYVSICKIFVPPYLCACMCGLVREI